MLIVLSFLLTIIEELHRHLPEAPCICYVTCSKCRSSHLIFTNNLKSFEIYFPLFNDVKNFFETHYQMNDPRIEGPTDILRAFLRI